MNRKVRIPLVAAGIAVLTALAACGDDEEDAATAPEGPHIAVEETELGEILVDEAGMTVYLFTMDSPGESVCTDDCLDAWPILEGEYAAGPGVDADLLGTIERDDGTIQATYADWPLYFFAADESPGDVQGQGVNDVWFVIDPAGEPVEGMANSDDAGY